MNLSKWSWLFLLGLSLAVSACIPNGRPTTQLCAQLGSLEAGRVEIRALPINQTYPFAIRGQKFAEIHSQMEGAFSISRKMDLDELREFIQSCQGSRVRKGTKYSRSRFWVEPRAQIRFLDAQGVLQKEMVVDGFGRMVSFGGEIYELKDSLSSRLVELVWGAEALQD